MRFGTRLKREWTCSTPTCNLGGVLFRAAQSGNVQAAETSIRGTGSSVGNVGETMILFISALYTLAGALAISAAAMGWFVVKDVKVYLDNKPETETASTEIRRWMRQSKSHFVALLAAILSLTAPIIYLLGHFPLGWW